MNLGINEFIKNILFAFSVNFLLPKSFFCNLEKNTCISTLLCHRDVDWFICSAVTFFVKSEIVLPVFIVDDGSLTQSDKEKLKKFFSVSFITDMESKKKILVLFQDQPDLLRFRFDSQTSKMKMKLDAFLLPQFDNVIYFDSDTLFFNKPIEILEWMNNPTENLCIRNTKSLSQIQVDLETLFRNLLFKYLNVPGIEDLNTGLICFNKKRLHLFKNKQKVLKFFRYTNYERIFTAEECLMAICLIGSKVLPMDKYKPFPFFDNYKQNFSYDLTFCHYCYQSKPKFKSDCLKFMLKTRFFRE